ncbi:MAG: hypothetical protein PHP84_09050, partial [Mesotoga sp.]|nr:hypothetical protein [Mesotoga sp.]
MAKRKTSSIDSLSPSYLPTKALPPEAPISTARKPFKRDHLRWDWRNSPISLPDGMAFAAPYLV